DIEIPTLSCGVSDIAYSTEYPNTIFASLDTDAGTKGNHLLLIDRESLLVQEDIPLPSSPKNIYFSGNKNVIYIVFSQSNYLGRLDLSNENRNITLIPSPTQTIFEHTDDIEISVAKHDDLFIGTLG